jgi:hypothetical protein
MTARHRELAAFRPDEVQEADLLQIERDRLCRALWAALNRAPTQKEFRRAWWAWCADNGGKG